MERFTLDQFFDGESEIPISGVYVIAYLTSILYVGQSIDIPHRMHTHCTNGVLPIDYWLQNMGWDYHNIRVDIHITASDDHMEIIEERMIKQFCPVYNTLLVISERERGTRAQRG